MSYLRILDDVDMEGLKQLVHHGLIAPASQVALHSTSLSVRVALEGDRYAKSSNVYELRILKSTVQDLVARAQEGYNTHDANRISLLYRTGLGLPLNLECHLLWDVISHGYAPKVNNRIFTYKDMVKVLVAHWKELLAENIDPFWLYFNPQNDYFKNLLEPSFPTVVKPDFLKVKKPVYVYPRYEGLDCSIVYRMDLKGKATLFAAYAKINKKMLNVTAQVLASDAVPNVLPEDSVPSGFGPFCIFSGVLTIKKSNQKLLRKEWGNVTVNHLIRTGLEQDLEPLPVYMDVKPASSHPSLKYVREHKARRRKAVNYLEQAKTKRLTKKTAQRMEKAQEFIDVYDEHEAYVEERNQEFNRLKDLDIVKHLEFIAIDCFGYRDSTLRKFTTPYSSVAGFIKGLGLTIGTTERAVSKTVNKLQQQAKEHALRNYTHDGLVCRVSENGANEPLTWVKFKF